MVSCGCLAEGNALCYSHLGALKVGQRTASLTSKEPSSLFCSVKERSSVPLCQQGTQNSAGFLQDLQSFGFRGEALSSLCAVSEVTVSTRTEADASGTRLFYDNNGSIVSTAPIARATGTTVAVKELFKPLPVRYKVAALACSQQIALLHPCRQLTRSMSVSLFTYVSDID